MLAINTGIFFSFESEFNLIYLLKTIFKTLTAREFNRFACLNGNRFAGRRIAPLPLCPLPEFKFPNPGGLNTAVFFKFGN